MESANEFDPSNDTLDFDERNVNNINGPMILWNVTTFQREIDEYILYVYGELHHINFPITFVVCLIGLVTNVFNIVVFTRKHMINSANAFLLALSIADIFIILNYFHLSVHYLLGFRYIFTYHYTLFYIAATVLEKANLMVCNWLVVAIGVWRLIAIKYPLETNRLCSMSRAKNVMAVIVVLSIVFSLPIFAVITYEELPKPFGVIYRKAVSKFAIENHNFFLLCCILMSFVAFVPCIVSIIATGLLIKSLVQLKFERKESFKNKTIKKSAQKDKSYRTTGMLIILLVLFILNNLPDTTLVLAAVLSSVDINVVRASKAATDIIRIFSMVNTSFSFFIYYFMGEHFRVTLKELFCSCFKSDDTSNAGSDSTYINSCRNLSSRHSNGLNVSLSRTHGIADTSHSNLTINTIS